MRAFRVIFTVRHIAYAIATYDSDTFRIIAKEALILACDTRAYPFAAYVIFGASDPIVARRSIRRRQTPGDSIARVVGAGIIVRATDWLPTYTGAVRTGFSGGASICIVAYHGITRVNASDRRVAGIVRTEFAIVAIERFGSSAPTVGTDVARCARIAVVAIGLIVRVCAAQVRVACIVGAEVSVVAYESPLTGCTDSFSACIPNRADRAI